MTDFAKEVFMEKIDSQFSKFGEPKLRKDLGLPEREVKLTENDIVKKAFAKLERENAWIEANTFTVKDRSDSRNRHHGKQNAKKRNKKLNKTKGKSSLYLAKRPENAGTRCVLSSRWSEHNKTFHKEWYPDTNKGMEQNKVSARELKKYFDSLVEDEAREKEFLEEYNEEIYDCTMEELVDEYLSLRSEGYRIKKDPYRYFQRNDLLDFMTVTTREGEDRTARFFRYFGNGDGEWIDYNTEYMCLSNLIFRMKQRKQTLAPIFDVAKTMSEELHVEIRVTTEMIPDNFHITQLNELAGLFLQYCPNSNEYTYCAMTRKRELIYLFAVERDFYTARELDFISRELEAEFQIMLF